MTPSSKEKFADLEAIADQMDSRFKGPFGWRWGWDGIIGLIPGFGDLITSSLSFYIIFRAAFLGAPPMVLLRMGLNVLLDNFFDKIPVLGLFLDFAWKSNVKNMNLLRRADLDPENTARQSLVAVIFVLLTIFILTIALIAVGFYLVWWFLQNLSAEKYAV